MTTTKSCTKCQETKPLTEFYLRKAGDPKGPRRSRCKACDDADGKRRRKQATAIDKQIARHTFDPSFPLSAEAEAAIYTDKPLDPELVATWKKRRENDRKAQMRREREATKRRWQSMPVRKFETVTL